MTRGLRTMAKRLVPPLVVDLVRRMRGLPRHDAPIWAGIYARFADVEPRGPGFEGEVWLSANETAVAEAWKAVAAEADGLPESVPPHHQPFALAVALLAGQRKPLRILDFGGGMGDSFVSMLRCLGGAPALDYRIVDNERSCRAGSRLLAGQPGLRFSSSLSEEAGEVDLLLASGVLQFVEDYRGVLEALARYRASYWLFTFLPAGAIPTFASAQKNVRGSVLPVWFFNLGELVGAMRGLGYRLVFRSVMDRRFDMENFPPSHRLSRQCHLLFKREAPA